ncbi:MAG: zinc-binding dehydrogenase [Verrucomicrobiae bacterium]|nr:zinc-binding dehydrogenase [Verrucomicrobiae bacterium]
MRAITIAAPRKIAFVDAPMPTLQDGEVLVRCKYVGLCGSNMGQYSGEGVWGELKFPNPIGWAGHENIGTIVESRCPDWKPGTLVLAQPEGYFGFAEYFRARPPGIAAIPPDAPDVAALIVAQPLATVLRAMTQTENVINQRCAVLGAGPMGLIWVHVLKQFGARQVIVTDVLDWRLDWAKRYGADAVVDVSKEKITDAVRELTHGQMLDFVATATTAPEALSDAVYLLRRGGRLFVFGMPHFNDQKFPWYAAFRNETKIITSVGPECADFFQVAMDMMLDGRASALGAMVTPRLPWEQAERAFEMYFQCARDSLKLVLVL